ncbi:MAG: PAS domain-containing protein [Oscillospiraceae bacterium]|nr:PAS domain-containing protein [Oscillospiraceae bacterium]
MNLEYFNNLADHLAEMVNISGNRGLVLIIAAAVVLFAIILLIVNAVVSAKKRKLALKAQELDGILEALYKVSPDMLVCKDNMGLFQRCNEAFTEFAGMGESQLIGKSLSELESLSERFNGEIVAADRKAVAEGITVRFRQELEYPDGSSKFFESVRTPVLRQKGTSKGILCIFRDLTEVNDAHRKSEELSSKLTEFEKFAQKDIDFENQINEQAKRIAVLEADLLASRKGAFCLKALKYIAAMGGALSDDNLPMYADHVISIKEDAAKIGAEELAKRAADLENAVDYQDRDFIKANHPDFIGELSKTLGELDAEMQARNKPL